MNLKTIVANGLDPQRVQDAAALIRAGELVAFPTETVYGLGANALDAAAVQKIFEAKDRPKWDPVIVHVSSLAMLKNVVREMPEVVERLAAKFWPGALTLLLPRSASVPDIVTAGRDLVGVRMPSHPVARKLIEAAGVPIAAPSANRFGRISPTRFEHVLADLSGRIPMILDAGPANVGVESTVLDPLAKPPIIYRPGGISREQLQAVLGEVALYDRHITTEAPPESLPSPGVGIRHYAPKARLMLISGQAEMRSMSDRQVAAGKKVGKMLPNGWRTDPGIEVFEWGEWGDWEQLAQRIYDGLRTLDARGCDVILCPMPPEEGLGLALRDRLRKASQ